MSESVTPTKSNRIADVKVVLDSKPSLSESASGSDIQIMEDGKRSVVLRAVIKLTVAALCGIVFGAALEKSRVFEPLAIRQQMVFENFIMLKMFLSAAATSTLCFSVLYLIPVAKDILEQASDEFVRGFINKGILTSTVGPFLLGMGMTMSGACPGMVLAQIGSWVPNSIFTLIGLLFGVLTYGLVEPVISRITSPKEPYKNTHVHRSLKKPYIAFAIPICLLMTTGVIIMEVFWGWEKDTRNMNRQNIDRNVGTAVSWPPYVGGIMIGLLQIPIVLVLHDTMGGSSSYVTVMSQWTITQKLQERFPYLAKMRKGVENWWQVFYVVFAIIGSLISGAASGSLNTSKGVPVYFALLGGILMIWGARLGSGCTSGHGISGMGLLAWLSLLAVPAMFAGAISLAFVMQATGALDHYVTFTGGV